MATCHFAIDNMAYIHKYVAMRLPIGTEVICLTHFAIPAAWAVMGYAMPTRGEKYHIRDFVSADGMEPFPDGLVRLAEVRLPADPDGEEVALDARGFRATAEIDVFRAIDAAVFRNGARPRRDGAARG